MDRPTEGDVRDALYNWLGFGNLNGKYWFVGREESIAISKCDNLDGWSEYFQRRAQFDRATDFRRTWEEAFGRPLSTFGTTTWHYQIAFLLAFHGHGISSSRVKEILAGDPQFCRTFSDHFSGEFFPCPKSSKNTIEPYSHIWDSVAEYHAEVAPRRLDAYARAVAQHQDVDVIVTYSPTFADLISDRFTATELTRWPDLAMDPIVASALQITPERDVLLLETPFLGYGRIGYDAIGTVVEELPIGG